MSSFQTCDSRLLEIYRQFPAVFAPPDDVPPPRKVLHSIRLKEGARPVRRPPYPLGPEKAKAMKEQVTDPRVQGVGCFIIFALGGTLSCLSRKRGERGDFALIFEILMPSLSTTRFPFPEWKCYCRGQAGHTFSQK